jgi:hypothetical protein
MDYPYPNYGVCTPEGTIALGANVQAVINAINTKTVIPYGDFGGPNIYWFQTFDNGLGNLVYTIFDRNTTLGLSSFMVRFGAAATIQQVVFQQYPRSQIDLQFLILPHVAKASYQNGTIIG